MHSSCQEISRNFDTMSITAAGKGPTLRGSAELERKLHYDGTANKGSKGLGFRGMHRIEDFAAWAAKRKESTIIVAGHSLWFKEFFKLYLPRAADHTCKKKKIVNCGAVGFTLQTASPRGVALGTPPVLRSRLRAARPPSRSPSRPSSGPPPRRVWPSGRAPMHLISSLAAAESTWPVSSMPLSTQAVLPTAACATGSTPARSASSTAGSLPSERPALLRRTRRGKRVARAAGGLQNGKCPKCAPTRSHLEDDASGSLYRGEPEPGVHFTVGQGEGSAPGAGVEMRGGRGSGEWARPAVKYSPIVFATDGGDMGPFGGSMRGDWCGFASLGTSIYQIITLAALTLSLSLHGHAGGRRLSVSALSRSLFFRNLKLSRGEDAIPPNNV